MAEASQSTATGVAASDQPPSSGMLGSPLKRLTGRNGTLLGYGASAVALGACLVVCLAIWGPGMDFPAAWGKPIGSKIDEWILWLTREAAWLFDGVKYVIIKVLVALEDFFLWLPWPVVIMGIALGAWKVAGRNMAPVLRGGTSAAGTDGKASRGHQHPVGRVYGDAVANSGIGRHIPTSRDTAGGPCIAKLSCRLPHAPCTGRYADDAQLCVSDTGNPIFWPGKCSRGDGDGYLRHTAGNPADQSRNSTGTVGNGGSGALFWNNADPAAY